MMWGSLFSPLPHPHARCPPEHTTLASSSWAQTWLCHPRCRHWTRRCSSPLHRTWLSQMGPEPSPNQAPDGAANAVPQPSCLQTTAASGSPQSSSQIVPQLPACSSSTRPAQRPGPPARRSGNETEECHWIWGHQHHQDPPSPTVCSGTCWDPLGICWDCLGCDETHRDTCVLWGSLWVPTGNCRDPTGISGTPTCSGTYWNPLGSALGPIGTCWDPAYSRINWDALGTDGTLWEFLGPPHTLGSIKISWDLLGSAGNPTCSGTHWYLLGPVCALGPLGTYWNLLGPPHALWRLPGTYWEWLVPSMLWDPPRFIGTHREPLGATGTTMCSGTH